jgi:D-alanine transaminase
LDEVRISPLDRGFLFADGIYEVIPAYNGHMFRLSEHLARLENGLAGIRLVSDISRTEYQAALEELVARNGAGNLAIYLQVTRGAPPTRDHTFPSDTPTTVFAMANPLKPVSESVLTRGVAAITGDDIRWGACHLKTIALLANVLVRQQAFEQDAAECILIRDGQLTEGSSSNLFLVADGVILTPRKDHRILPGITRDVVLELAAANDIRYQEQDVPASALETASEVWITSTTKEITPVTSVNGHRIGNGAPGPIWRRMMDLFQKCKGQVSELVA